MSYVNFTKGMAITRRGFLSGGSIEIIFTPSSRHTGYLLDGRVRRNPVDGGDEDYAKGYLFLGPTGSFANGYGGTLSLVNAETGVASSLYSPGVTYKLTITGVSDGKCICFIGSRYYPTNSGWENFKGKIHSVKCLKMTTGYAGSTTPGEGGSPRDLLLQFDHIRGDGLSPTPSNYNNYAGLDEEQRVVGVVPHFANGWTHNASANTWTSTKSGWNRLYLLKSENSPDGQRAYERVYHIKCNLSLNGKSLMVYYDRPDGTAGMHTCVEGFNQFSIHAEKMTEHDKRPKVDSPESEGVVISNLEVYESNGALIVGGEWS